jgi:hypothetical protein
MASADQLSIWLVKMDFDPPTVSQTSGSGLEAVYRSGIKIHIFISSPIAKMDLREILSHSRVRLCGAMGGSSNMSLEQAGPPSLHWLSDWQWPAGPLSSHLYFVNAAIFVEADRLDADAAIEVAGL